MNKFEDALEIFKRHANGKRLNKRDPIIAALTQAAEIERGDKVVVPRSLKLKALTLGEDLDGKITEQEALELINSVLQSWLQANEGNDGACLPNK